MNSYKFTYSEENRMKDIAMKLIKVVKNNCKLKFNDKELLMIRKMAMLHQTDNNLLIEIWMKVNPNMTEEESKYTLDLMLSNTKWNYFDTSNLKQWNIK
ncbi:hypothetical protein GAG94_03155 [Lysinibacillus sphaericus]|nr:hypothetical protein GAG94_03155 [Lysinibacillus sphaericus]